MASACGRAESIRASVQRRGITFRVRAAEMIRNVPEKSRDLPDGRPARHARRLPPMEFAAAEQELRRERTKALIHHARAVGDIFAAQDAGGKVRAEHVQELKDAIKAFDEVRLHGSTDAEAA